MRIPISACASAARAFRPETDWHLVATMPENGIIRPLFRHLALPQRTPPAGWELLERQTMRLLFVAFLTGQYDTARESEMARALAKERALAFVRDRWAKGRLASPRASCVSARHLGRLFHDTVGGSPLAAIRLMRLERAAVLLPRTEPGVAKIAHQVGFESPFHFSRRYREAFGHSPRVFRRRVGEQPRWWSFPKLLRVRPLAKPLWAMLAPVDEDPSAA